MNIHTVITTALVDEYTRQVVEVQPHEDYDDLMEFPKMVVNRFYILLMELNYRGAAILQYKHGSVGIGCLVLDGSNIRGNKETEQMFCKKFMHQTANPPNWCLPLPPLEIESRPLCYYAMFRLDATLSESQWHEEALRCVQQANIVGATLIRSMHNLRNTHKKKHEEKEDENLQG